MLRSSAVVVTIGKFTLSRVVTPSESYYELTAKAKGKHIKDFPRFTCFETRGPHVDFTHPERIPPNVQEEVTEVLFSRYKAGIF